MERDKRGPQRPVNTALRYSALGLQMLITMGIAGWLGYLFDRYLEFKFPLFMLLLGFSAFGGTLYSIYRNINKK